MAHVVRPWLGVLRRSPANLPSFDLCRRASVGMCYGLIVRVSHQPTFDLVDAFRDSPAGETQYKTDSDDVAYEN